MLKFLTKIRLELTHSADHKFRHNFQDCANPLCTEKVKKIDLSILKQNDQVFALTKILLFRDEKLKSAQNKSILTSTTEFLQATEKLFN